MHEHTKYPWLWDVDIDSETFRRILLGESKVDGRDWRWALVRLVEYAPYADIRRLLPTGLFVAHWRDVAHRVRSETRREGMDYLHERLLQKVGDA